jgi:adenylylsulfate kinase
MVHSTNTRSFVKAACYRVITTTITTGAVYLLTHKWSITVAMFAIDGILMTGIYYLHERMWQRIKWGRISGK